MPQDSGCEGTSRWAVVTPSVVQHRDWHLMQCACACCGPHHWYHGGAHRVARTQQRCQRGEVGEGQLRAGVVNVRQGVPAYQVCMGVHVVVRHGGACQRRRVAQSRE